VDRENGDVRRDLGETLLTRRDTLRWGIAGVALIYSFDKAERLAARPSGKPGPARRAQLTSPFEPFRVDLPRLPVLRPIRRTPDVERYELTVRDGIARILPGFETPVMGYNGIFPGPTIRARRGRRSVIRQLNHLPDEVNTHLHGGLVHEDSDGALHQYHIPPGGARTYYYPNAQPQSTLWFHDHTHGLTGEHMNGGLTAFYIIGDHLDRKRRLPRGGPRDVPLMIQDRSFNDDGSLRYAQNLGAGFHGDTILVNGAVAPRMRVKRRVYRLRFLNASNARIYRLMLGQGRVMHQIAGDAGLLPRPRKRRAITLAPGERAEVLVDFRRFRPGTKLVLRNLLGEASTAAVMRFDVVRAKGGKRDRIPKRLRPWERMPAPARTRNLSLDFQTSPTLEWQINGKGFDNDRIDERTRLGTAENWRFVNDTEHAHPMHLHGCHFRVISVNGRRPHPGDRGWKDTVNVWPGQSVVVRPYFRQFAGRYVFHCHTAEHSDVSMMGVMEIES
jgi:spore coat protein A